MKKFSLLGLIALIAMLAGSVFALDDIDVPANFYDGVRRGTMSGNETSVTFSPKFKSGYTPVVLITPNTTSTVQSIAGEIQAQAVNITNEEFDNCGCAGIEYGYVAF